MWQAKGRMVSRKGQVLRWVEWWDEEERIERIYFECPICGIRMWADADQGDILQQIEDEHLDTCGEEGQIDASEVED